MGSDLAPGRPGGGCSEVWVPHGWLGSSRHIPGTRYRGWAACPSRCPISVGDQVALRPVFGHVRQRSAAGLAAGAALGADDRQIVRERICVITQEHRNVQDHRISVVTAGNVQEAEIDDILSADQRAGEFRVVFHQQAGGGFQQIDPMHQVVLVRADQIGAGTRKPTDVEKQLVKLLGIGGDRRARGAGGVEHRHDVACRRTEGVTKPLERAVVGLDGPAAGINRHQHLVQVGGGLADGFALAAKPLGHGRQDSV